jgi:primosomal protein N' (replication factor Y) (superfamily II helicase)
LRNAKQKKQELANKMSYMSFADILFQQKVGEDSSTLTYEIPKGMKLSAGHLVKVPLRNRTVTGLVWKTHNDKPSFKTVEIKELAEKEPLINKLQLKTIEWMAKYYFCPIYKISKLFIPKRVFAASPIRQRKTPPAEQITRTKPHKLTDNQKKAISHALTNKSNKFLIHGVTGSGKTEVYARIAEDFIKKGRQVLVMVPEIALTPQTIDYFQKTLGINPTVIHSKLSEGERYKAWKDIHANEAKLVIGSRSSLFAPFQDLALIIVDEEHEPCYKQDSSPRYITHRIIEKYQSINPKLKVIFGSATPSIAIKEQLKDHTIDIHKRIGKSELPDIEIVDLREEFHKKNYSIFSDRLREELEETLKNKEQAILFLNRRGTSSSVVCRDCGYTAKCNTCDVPFTYHASTLSKPKLICHHCGKIEEPPEVCPKCKGHNIRYLGIGTQRIEAELKKEFPKARILRADKDTTSRKGSFEKIYRDFKAGKADFLVGTQMIAKGLDLPRVNLVGAILADIGLNIPDFHSVERNFQLMTQVAGRAGRASNRGKVIIQTYMPDNAALKYTQIQEYEHFFKYEIKQRELMNNPPFSRLTKLTIQDKSANQVAIRRRSGKPIVENR